MNGAHDMGGMHGFGPIEIEPDERLFHAEWEGRARAITMLSPFNLDELRFFIEDVQPAAYLNTTYFERWLNATARSWIHHGFVSEEELDRRIEEQRQHPDSPMPPWPGQSPDLPPYEKYKTPQAPAGLPQFAVGDRVHVKNIHPAGHTRVPRYVRGRRGVIDQLRGQQIFPDTNAHGLGHFPQMVYSVRFDATELWGDAAEPNQNLSIDLWESYLERARPQENDSNLATGEPKNET